MTDEKKDEQDKKKKLKQGESEDITKKATDEEKDFKTSGIEGTKDGKVTEHRVPTDPDKPEIVRGEDVVKILRAKGVKI